MRRDKVGQTLLAVAVVISGCLSLAFALQDKEKRDTCHRLILQLEQACQAYEIDYALYPTSGNASMVKALTTKGPKRFPYFDFAKGMLNDKGEVLDPWGHPLVYHNNTDKSAPKDWTAHRKNSFDLYSFGPDGKDDKGKGDDVNNWD